MTIGPVVVGCIGFAMLFALGFAVLHGLRGYERVARKALAKRFQDLEIHPTPQPGDVLLVYHTYHGVLPWFTQIEHRVHLPPDRARELLGRLLRFNCIWGLTAHGGLLVLPLSLFNYITQAHSLSSQEAQAAGRA